MYRKYYISALDFFYHIEDSLRERNIDIQLEPRTNQQEKEKERRGGKRKLN